MPPGSARRPLAVGAWCLYDFANSAFPTVVTTFVFAAYFTKGIAETPEAGTAAWGYAMGLAGLVVALVSPVLGAVADRSGRLKPWIAVATVVCVLGSAALWTARPDPGMALWALSIVVLATIAFEIGGVFYNAMIAEVAPPGRLGRVSGWGWGLGYGGGLACLVVALFVLVQPDPSPLGLDRETAEHVRATGPLVALWFAIFSLPLFFLVPDRPATGMPLRGAVTEGLATLRRTLRNVRRYRTIVRFLIARMIYTDGLITLFAFGGIYAAGTFGMTFEEVVRFGIALNVTAGLGAAAFAWVDDRIGSRPTILIALAALTVFGGATLVVADKGAFWALGLGLGLFVGPAQAASRTLMARLAPEDLRAEMFGLFALSGKATAFLGPIVLAAATDLFASQRAGMATILVFFAVGGALLLTVRGEETGRGEETAAA